MINEAVSKLGVSPLIAAARNGHVKAVEFLLDNGADIHAASGTGTTTAIHVAAQLGHTAVIALLLQRGATLTTYNCTGRTPFLVAISMGRLEAAKLLLQKGTTLTERSRGGETPLLIAAGVGQLPTLQWLLSQGASLDDRNSASETALDRAKRNGYPSIVAFISEYKKNHQKPFWQLPSLRHPYLIALFITLLRKNILEVKIDIDFNVNINVKVKSMKYSGGENEICFDMSILK